MLNLLAQTELFCQMLTRGVRCSTANCKTMLHHHCYKNYTKNGRNNCMTCNKVWADDHPVKPIGEDAYREGQEQNNARTRRVVNANDTDDEEEEDEEFEENEGPSQRTQRTQTQAKKATKAKGKGKKAPKREESMEVDELEDEDAEEDEDGEDTPPPRTQPKRKSRR